MTQADETGEVTLFNSECRRGVLPEVCVKCGAGTRRVRRTLFIWTPRWVYALWLLGPLGMLMTIGATKRRTVFLPVCSGHRSFFSFRAPLYMVCGMLWAFIGFLAIVSMEDYHGPGSDYARAAIGVTALVVLVAGMVAGFAVGKRDIHAVEITETRLVLKHVHLDFIDALEDDRDRDDEHYEARRAARRPRRDRRDRRDPRDQRGR